MCMLIWKPSDKTIPRQKLFFSDENNSDGIGMAYVDDGELIIDKGYKKFEEFHKEYLKVEHKDVLIHFRAASPGMTVNSQMCHPFHVDYSNFLMDDKTVRYEFAIGHNGRLPWNPDKGKSDTCMFVEEFLGPHLSRDPYFFDSFQGKAFLEKFVGDFNKLLILRFDRKKGKLDHYIINEKGGVGAKQARWVDGVWYSNDSFNEDIVVNHQNNIHQGYFGWMGGHYNPYGGVGQGAAKAQQEQQKQVPTIKQDAPKDNGDKIIETLQSVKYGQDSKGWFWDFDKDTWRNKQTGHMVTSLEYRKERPLYFEIKEAQKAKMAGAVVITPEWPPVKSGSIGTSPEGDKIISITTPPTEVGKQESEVELNARYKREGDLMRLDASILTKDEFHEKWGFYLQTKAPDLVVSQPASTTSEDLVRKNQVGYATDEIEEDDDVFINKLMTDKFSPAERNRIHKEAADFFKAEFTKKELRNTSRAQRINYMANTVRGGLMPNASLEAILRWVLTSGENALSTIDSHD